MLPCSLLFSSGCLSVSGLSPCPCASWVSAQTIDSTMTYFCRDMHLRRTLSAKPIRAAQSCVCVSVRPHPAGLSPSCCLANLCLSFHIMQSSYRAWEVGGGAGNGRHTVPVGFFSVQPYALLDFLRRGLRKMLSALAFRMEAEISARIRAVVVS